MFYPQPGWVELDMGEVGSAPRNASITRCRRRARPPVTSPRSGSRTSASPSSCGSGGRGEAVAHSITWQDTRTAAAADALAADGGIDRFQSTTGLPISMYSVDSHPLSEQRHGDKHMRITVLGRGNVGVGLADLWERAGRQVTRL